jgi:predicted adenine nucleotide alpha hydrolase (AANH) superfamily ATPase
MKKKPFKNIRLQSYKDYASKYGISVIDPKYKPNDKKYYRNVNTILNEIYNYERSNRPSNPLYPFFSN